MNKVVAAIVLVAILTGMSAAVPAEERIPVAATGGVYTIPVGINGAVTLSFILDTGASTVLIPADVALTLMRTGTISESDIGETMQAVLADGSVVEKLQVNLRSLQIGSVTLHNVEAIVGGHTSSLLLGQSALRRLEPWSLDTRGGHLVVAGRDSGPASVAALTVPGGARETRLSGWTADRNAAVVGRKGADDGLGINFPLSGQGSRLVVCSGDAALRGAASVRVAVRVDGKWVAGGAAGASPRSNACWTITLPQAALYAIKNGSWLQVSLADRASYQVNLTGSAKALNLAWGYVEERLPQAP